MSVWNDEGRHDPAVQRTPSAEFHVYFYLIFFLGLPFAVIAWAWDLASGGERPAMGPLARAWHEAGIVTPMIFRP